MSVLSHSEKVNFSSCIRTRDTYFQRSIAHYVHYCIEITGDLWKSTQKNSDIQRERDTDVRRLIWHTQTHTIYVTERSEGTIVTFLIARLVPRTLKKKNDGTRVKESIVRRKSFWKARKINTEFCPYLRTPCWTVHRWPIKIITESATHIHIYTIEYLQANGRALVSKHFYMKVAVLYLSLVCTFTFAIDPEE